VTALAPLAGERSPAVVGAVAWGLLLLLANAALGWIGHDPAPALFLHVSGVERPGWYGGETAGRALEAAGARVAFLVGAPRDGDAVTVYGSYAIVAPAPGAVSYRATGARLHLNTATLADLESLPRVGPTLAARIRAGRPYRDVADLDRVKGVGPATIRALSPFVQP